MALHKLKIGNIIYDAWATAADVLGLRGSNVNATITAVLQAIKDNAGVPTLTIPNTTLAQELAPNTLYTFESRTNNLTLTLGTPIVGKASEYHLFLVAGAAVTVTWPSGIQWNGGSAPTITAGNTYEVSILDGVAAFIEVEP